MFYANVGTGRVTRRISGPAIQQLVNLHNYDKWLDNDSLQCDILSLEPLYCKNMLSASNDSLFIDRIGIQVNRAIKCNDDASGAR